MKTLTLPSYAKLNLYLAVKGRRRDNYHTIETLFERIDISDRITLRSLRDDAIRISCDSPHVPSDSTNLAYKSARLLQEELRLKKGVAIRIAKRIPVAAGMGGGSSNAASVLLGLNKLWALGLSRKDLAGFAKKLGADVPFFIYDCPFALGTSRGDVIRPLAALNRTRLWHIVAVPRLTVSTVSIYKRWDSVKSRLTAPGHGVTMICSALQKKDISLLGGALYNSLEQVTTVLYPEVRRLTEEFARFGLDAVLMSGSGPAVFSIVSSSGEAASFCRRLKERHPSWRVFAAQTR